MRFVPSTHTRTRHNSRLWSLSLSLSFWTRLLLPYLINITQFNWHLSFFLSSFFSFSPCLPSLHLVCSQNQITKSCPDRKTKVSVFSIDHTFWCRWFVFKLLRSIWSWLSFLSFFFFCFWFHHFFDFALSKGRSQAHMNEQVLAFKKLEIQQKRFYLDVKQNSRGRFIKIAEVSKQMMMMMMIRIIAVYSYLPFLFAFFFGIKFASAGRKNRLLLSIPIAHNFKDQLTEFNNLYVNLGKHPHLFLFSFFYANQNRKRLNFDNFFFCFFFISFCLPKHQDRKTRKIRRKMARSSRRCWSARRVATTWIWRKTNVAALCGCRKRFATIALDRKSEFRRREWSTFAMPWQTCWTSSATWKMANLATTSQVRTLVRLERNEINFRYSTHLFLFHFCSCTVSANQRYTSSPQPNTSVSSSTNNNDYSNSFNGASDKDLPEGISIRVENKRFFFDVRQNTNGVFMRVSEVISFSIANPYFVHCRLCSSIVLLIFLSSLALPLNFRSRTIFERPSPFRTLPGLDSVTFSPSTAKSAWPTRTSSRMTRTTKRFKRLYLVLAFPRFGSEIGLFDSFEHIDQHESKRLRTKFGRRLQREMLWYFCTRHCPFLALFFNADHLFCGPLMIIRHSLIQTTHRHFTTHTYKHIVHYFCMHFMPYTQSKHSISHTRTHKHTYIHKYLLRTKNWLIHF